MPANISLNTLATHFRTGTVLPPALKQFWNSIQRLAKTPEQKTILASFRSNPSSQNLSRVAAMLRKVITPTKHSGIKLGFGSDKPKPKEHGSSTFKVWDISNYRYTGRSMGGDKTPGTTGWRSTSGAAKKKAAPKKKAAVKKTAKKAAPKKKAAPRAKAKNLSGKKAAKKPVDQVKIFTRASLNNQLALKQAEPVSITISRERLKPEKGKLSKTTSALVTETKMLRVQIKPVLNCKASGQHTYTIPVPEEDNPAELMFSIVGTHTGKAEFSVDVWQGYELAATLLFSVNVAVEKTDTETAEIRVTNNPTGNMTGAVNQLRINQQQNGNKSGYDYEVSFGDINEWQTYESPELNKKTANYVSDLYKQIEQLYSDAAGNAKQFDEKLKRYGADLFLTLFPADLQQLLYDNRDKLKSIQVISNEPDIPWEILVIRNPDTSKPTRPSDPFFAELGIIRWIRRGAFPGQQLQSRAARSKFVIPAYHHEKRVLPKAAEETALLTRTFKATQVPATVQAVEALLKGGAFDLLHFCCHGEGETTNNIGARLVMEEIKERGNWKPTYVDQLFVEQCGTFIRKGSPQPIIVLNGCRTGILGKKVAGYGGFAKAFINAGAAVFVGGLWNVEDSAAYEFVLAFYKSLKKGKNLSEATIEARNQSKAANNATWLAYVVYGNPFAKLI